MSIDKDTTILIMFSGGIDSTYMLHHYLTQTDDPLHVHHISMRYPSEPRWKQEDEACDKIVAYCQKIRPFTYTTSCIDFGFRYYFMIL